MRGLEAIRENALLSRWAKLLPRNPQQIGGIHETDAELVKVDDGRVLAITIDTVAEEIGTGLYRNARTAGRIAAIASISDVAAVGADPIGMLLSVTLPPHNPDGVQRDVGEAVAEVCSSQGLFVLGGDTNEGEALAITSVLAGWVPAERVITRIGACPGDIVYASGPLGLGTTLAASNLLDLNARFDEEDFRPIPRLREGSVVRKYASCCMDTSDGLVATLDQLGKLNNVGFDVRCLPEEILHPEATRVRDQTGLPSFPFIASQHGEFELVFTVEDRRRAELLEQADAIGWTPLQIGVCTDTPGILLGGTLIDGVLVRNLWSEVGGDVNEYARRLISMEPRW